MTKVMRFLWLPGLILLGSTCLSAWGANLSPNVASSTVPSVNGQLVPAAPLTPAVNRIENPYRPTTYVPPMYFPPVSGPLKPRQITARDFYLNCVERSVTKTLIVKFNEEAMIRWRDGGVYSKSGASLAQVKAFLARHPEIAIRREMDEIPEATLDFYESNGEKNIGEDLANLNNFYVLDVKSNPVPLALLQEVTKLDVVETAFYQPVGEPACADLAPTTPNWVANQTYHGPSPLGVNADYAGTYFSGWGHGAYWAWTCDIEWSWTDDHEDFPSDVPNGYGFEVLNGGDNGQDGDHGDGCSGIIGACNNSYGMEGESYNVTPKGVSVNYRTWASAIALAQGDLYTGESEFIEIHAYGPDPGYACDDVNCGNCGQFGYIAIEYWDDNYNAILTATSNGRLVYEAAGNGAMDLDAARYGNHFNRGYRDSGAILVGAGHSWSLDAMCWSNYGSRIDCHGWGENVYTLGYGDLFNPTGDPNQKYTAYFSGTSSATPIVTASGNDLQGICQGKYGVTMTPAQVRSILSSTGTPHTGARNIATRPDLVNAINAIEPNLMPYKFDPWQSPIVPRNDNLAAWGNPVFPNGVVGESNSTWLNVAGLNNAITPAPDSSGAGGVPGQISLDGDLLYNFGWGRIAPYQAFIGMNFGPITVRGGRHTLQFNVDPSNVVNESNENDNWIYRQYIWSPPRMFAPNSYQQRVAPPLHAWGSPVYFNGDAFRDTSQTWWLGAAVLPQSGNDVDIYAYEDNSYVNDTLGFETFVSASTEGTGATDFVLVNGNFHGERPERLFQAMRYTDGSTGNYITECDGSLNESWYAPYSRIKSFGATEIFDIYEIYMAAGTPYFVAAGDLTGGLDLSLAIYGPSSEYYARGDISWITNSQGANGSEYLIATPSVAGWYAAVVYKSDYNGWGVSGSYTFRFESPGQVNLQPGISRSGWAAPLVARNTSDATLSNAQFPTAIQGNTDVFWSGTWYNSGSAVSPASFVNRADLDGAPATDMNNSVALAPFAYGQTMNSYIGFVRGGRHTLAFTVDNTSVVTESNEADNTWSGQYVFSPRVLSDGRSQIWNAPPLHGSGAYYNSDGYSFTTPTSYAAAIGVASKQGTADYDMYLYSDYAGTFSGYSLMMGASAYGGGAIDYVVFPYRLTYSNPTVYPAVINYSSASDSFYVEGMSTVNRAFSSSGWGLAVPDTIPAGSLFRPYEILLNPGVSYVFNCNVVAGDADIALCLFRDSTTVLARGSSVAFMDAAGAGGSEVLTYTPPVYDWYVLVVEKNTSSSVAHPIVYYLMCQPNQANPVNSLVIQNWDTPAGSKRLAWNHVTRDWGNQPLVDRRYVIYRSVNFSSIPQATDSIGTTTDSTYIDSGPFPQSGYFYNVKVRAQ